MGRLKNPLVQVALLYVSVIALAVGGREVGGLAAMAAMAVFALVNPLAVALGQSWWLHTAASSVLFVSLFVVLGATPAIDAMREGATVFLFPFMLYVAAVPIGGLVRLWRWRRSSASRA